MYSSGVAGGRVDANTVISGGGTLASTTGRLVTVPEVLNDVWGVIKTSAMEILVYCSFKSEYEKSNI